MSDDWFEKRKQERLATARKRRRRDGIVVATALALIVTALFLVKQNVGGGEDVEARAPQPPPPSRTIGPAGALERQQLKGLADTIAVHLERGNMEVAASIILQAEMLTGCNITAYTGGAGGADLGVKENRDFVAKDAASKGIPIAFGHKKDTWIVVAQVCE